MALQAVDVGGDIWFYPFSFCLAPVCSRALCGRDRCLPKVLRFVNRSIATGTGTNPLTCLSPAPKTQALKGRNPSAPGNARGG
jgi:hypothetical protein